MLKKIIMTERGLSRHRTTYFAPYIEDVLSDLERQGYTKKSMYLHLWCIKTFGEYLTERNIKICDLQINDLEDFIQWYLSKPRCVEKKRTHDRESRSLSKSMKGYIRNLYAYLQNRGIITLLSEDLKQIPYQDILDQYISFLRNHRGLADSTIKNHHRWTKAFLVSLTSEKCTIPLKKLSPNHVERFVIEESGKLGIDSRSIMISTLNNFLRYLKNEGYIPESCVPFLPRAKKYSFAELPSTIPWSSIKDMLNRVNRTTPMGRRDYAILMLFITYGLRASEVAGLRLENIDWRRKVICVHQQKSRTILELPLTGEVATALVDYLRQGRPPTTYRQIFITCQAPLHPITRCTAYHIVKNALRKAGIHTNHYGPHTLRHSRATFLLRQGNSLKTIGDLLGHQVTGTTLLYCKLAVEDLRSVTLELPEVHS